VNQLTEEQIKYIDDFVRELHEKVEHSGVESNELFIDDIRMKGIGSYIFFPLGDSRIVGRISVYDDKANLALEVSARISLEGDEATIAYIEGELTQIEKETGTGVISDDTWDEVRRFIGNAGISLFREGKPYLTVDSLITDHMRRISQAASAVHTQLKAYIVEPTQKISS